VIWRRRPLTTNLGVPMERLRTSIIATLFEGFESLIIGEYGAHAELPKTISLNHQSTSLGENENLELA
jgi:hypothetical protein